MGIVAVFLYLIKNNILKRNKHKYEADEVIIKKKFFMNKFKKPTKELKDKGSDIFIH